VTVLRWKLIDPSNTDVYTFPRNPLSMTSPYRVKAVTASSTTNGKILLTEGAQTAQQWSFSGPLLDKQNLLDLLDWTYDRRRRVLIQDHFSRQISCYLTGLDVQPKRRTGYYYSHDYTINALVLDVSAPTVANAGPA
jgi:hypothetical protein